MAERDTTKNSGFLCGKYVRNQIEILCFLQSLPSLLTKETCKFPGFGNMQTRHISYPGNLEGIIVFSNGGNMSVYTVFTEFLHR